MKTTAELKEQLNYILYSIFLSPPFDEIRIGDIRVVVEERKKYILNLFEEFYRRKI